MKRRTSLLLAAAAMAASVVGGAAVTNAAPPQVATDAGAFVRLLGDPSTGDVKFQYGWNDEFAEQAPEGYWLGIYDVTNGHYVWAFDSIDPESENFPAWSLHPSLDLTQAMKRNAKPTIDLPNGKYQVNFFVRGSYEPVVNLAEIEFEFDVTNSMG